MLALTPLLVPLITALLCTLTQSAPRLQHGVSLLGALALLVCTTLLLLQVAQGGSVTMVAGNWPLPFGIEFVGDRLSAALALIAAVMVTIAVLWQWSDADAAPASPALHPLLHGLVAGVGGAFVTADLFNLYVWFELALICALGLLAHGGSARQLDATLKYFVLNVFGTLLLLTAVALLYAVTWHLNFAALAQATAQMEVSVKLPLLGLLLLAFLVKAAAFPFFAWLPASYHTLPAPMLALFSALLTKVGIYAVIRTLSDVFAPVPELLFAGLGWIAVL
ncbi:MAG: Na+/H+ antiporter subunit D, partial [Gammaproteobacteria bacterium]|nr:Na+/H+ antiporter subunit D [Gammaproteobacteria bacterium]